MAQIPYGVILLTLIMCGKDVSLSQMLVCELLQKGFIVPNLNLDLLVLLHNVQKTTEQTQIVRTDKAFSIVGLLLRLWVIVDAVLMEATH